MEDGFQCFRPEFSALLIKGGGRWGIRLQAEKIKQLYPGAGRTAGNQEGYELIRPHFSGTGKIPSRSDHILGDVGYNMVDGIVKSGFDFSYDIKCTSLKLKSSFCFQFQGPRSLPLKFICSERGRTF